MAVLPILSAALLTGLFSIQTPPAPARQDVGTSQLEEIVVEGVRRREAAEVFVQSVAEPIPGRKLARWRDSVCVGVGGLRPEAGRFIVDRVSDWAASVGLTIEPPGCEPQIFIIATADGDATARDLVASRPRDFDTGASQTNRGSAALVAFQNSGRLIRWWHVSLPVNGNTGMPIIRLPGQAPFSAGRMTRPSDFGSYANTVSASRLTDESEDHLTQAIIVLDMAALDQAGFGQITDYIAMVALAQIAPDADPAGPSILRLFSPDEVQEETLTRWDRAYLRALYLTSQLGAGTGSNLRAIASGVARDLERQDAAGAGEPEAAD